jgi:DNA polymerase I-like protein with 3'-5' exonuclease and polymerase domains
MGVRFATDYEVHTDRTDELRNAYLDMFPGLRPYFSRQRAFLLKHGYVVNRIGQVRHLPLSDGKDTPGFGRMVNQAINFPIQSLASAVTGSGLIDSEEALVAEYFKGDLVEYHARLLAKDWPEMPIVINEVHDSLLHDVPEKHELRAKAIVKECMESTKSLRGLLPGLPPLRVETKLGPHWGMKE